MGLKHQASCLLLIFIAGCGEIKSINNPKPIDHAISSAIIAASNLETQQVIPNPNNPKVGDKCPQCNDPPGKCGVGKVGDGVTCQSCPMCRGDGKIDEKDLNNEIEEAKAPEENVILPSETKVNDDCPHCNNPAGACGPGKLGDGVICTACPSCGGDGKIDEDDMSKQFAMAYIINMRSRDSCYWCNKWKQEIKPQLEKSGYIINIIDSDGTVPRFEIISNGKKYTHNGFMSLKQFKDLQDKINLL